MITSAHSKNFNSSGFNPTLQKLDKMICVIIVCKTVCEIFLIFCRSSLINNFAVKNSFSEPKNQQMLSILRPVYFKKISAHLFIVLICTNKLEGIFFLKNFFQGLGVFFTTATRLIWASFFSTQRILFFQGWLFNFNVILKTSFKNLFRKTVKKMAILPKEV